MADTSQAFADVIIEGGSFSEKMNAIFKQLGKSMISALIGGGIWT